jgi:hypothetical protein
MTAARKATVADYHQTGPYYVALHQRHGSAKKKKKKKKITTKKKKKWRHAKKFGKEQAELKLHRAKNSAITMSYGQSNSAIAAAPLHSPPTTENHQKKKKKKKKKNDFCELGGASRTSNPTKIRKIRVIYLILLQAIVEEQAHSSVRPEEQFAFSGFQPQREKKKKKKKK